MLDALSEFAIQLAVTLADAALLLLATAPSPGPTPLARPPRVKDPAAAFLRAGRALLWLSALANVFTGLYLLPRRRQSAASRQAAPTPPACLAVSPPQPRRGAPSARAARPLGEDRYMRAVFSTLPIGEIAARICRDLGLTAASELWPADFLAITETLPEWAARTLPPEPRAIRASRATSPRGPRRAAPAEPGRHEPPVRMRPVRSG